MSMFASISLEVIDPCNRTGKINIPEKHVIGTKGVSDFRSNPAKRDGKELSLCLLFQKGRCNAGSKCHQVHADPDFVNALREKALSVKNCCASHGDVHSCGFLSVKTTVVIFSADDAHTYDISSMGRTSFLDGLLRNASNNVVRVSASKVCRLHSQSRCKFGKDCKNIHLCPDARPIAAALPQLPMLPKRVFAPASVDVTCGLSNTSKCSEDSTPLESPKLAPIASLDSGCFSSVQELSCLTTSWGASVVSPKFDMSAFEQTIRCLQLDLTAETQQDCPLAVCPPKRR